MRKVGYNGSKMKPVLMSSLAMAWKYVVVKGGLCSVVLLFFGLHFSLSWSPDSVSGTTLSNQHLVPIRNADHRRDNETLNLKRLLDC